MPSTSKAQARLMAAVAHGWHKPGGGGPPVSVAKDFNQADKGRHMSYAKGGDIANVKYAKGGSVLGRTTDFLKTPNEFTTEKNKSSDEDFGKGTKSPGVVPKNTAKVLKR
jgi:hypothetical protein